MKKALLIYALLALLATNCVEVLSSNSEGNSVKPLVAYEFSGWLSFGEWSEYWDTGYTSYLTISMEWHPPAELYVYFYDYYKEYVGKRDLLTGGWIEREYYFGDIIVAYFRLWYHDYYQKNNLGDVYYLGWVYY